MGLSRLYNLQSLLAIVFISVTIGFAIKMLGAFGILPWSFAYSDIPPWIKDAFAPGIPYIDKPVAYPVVMGFIMFFASRFDLAWYYIFHYVLFVSCALVTTYYLHKLAEIYRSDKKYLLLCWALAPSLFWYSYINWDIVVVMITVLALYCYKSDRDTLGSMLLAVGFATKFYPILLLWPALLGRPVRDWIAQGSVFFIAFAGLNAYFAVASFETWSFIFSFHDLRAPNPDNVWAVLHLLIPSLTISHINTLSFVVFLFLYVFLLLRFRREDITVLWLFAILAFLLANKVFSPQYILWILPLFVLRGVPLKAYWWLEAVNLIVLFCVLRFLFSPLGQNAMEISNIFVVVRHALLIYLLVYFYRAFTRRVEPQIVSAV